ncbi:MAG: hypothetical protein JWM85_3616 [Acidimicrobiaceae bacterium]|nr:hypothetical protein [Acidimicrobiaceae bacterium]
MSLLDTLKADLLNARKLKSAGAVAVLSTFLGDLETNSKKTGKPIEDDEIVALAKNRVSTTKDMAELIAKTDAAAALVPQAEILFYERYIPPQLSDEDIRTQIALLKVTVAAEFSLKKVQSYFKTHFAGRYDGKLVASVFKTIN